MKDFSRLATESVDGWDAICPKLIQSCMSKDKSPLYCLAWTRFGKSLLIGAHSGEALKLNGSTFAHEDDYSMHKAAIVSMILSHNENLLASGDSSGEIRLWDRNMKLVKGFLDQAALHTESIRDISFAPGDNKMVTCSDDKIAKVTDIETGKQDVVFLRHGAEVKACQWHPHKGLIMSGGKDNFGKLWDPKSGDELCTLYAHHQQINKIRWHSNGNWVMTASKDTTVRVHDIRTMKTIANFQQHKKEVTSIAWHPSIEDLLVSGAADNSLIYWSMKDLTIIKEVTQAHGKEVSDILWHPLGHVLATCSQENTAKVWCNI